MRLETITLRKVPRTIRRLERPRVSPMLLHPRAPRLLHLALSLRHHQLAPRALVAAAAVIQAEARLRVRHLRRLHLRLRLTPRHLPPAEEVEAADRTDPLFVTEISKKKNGSSAWSRFSFLGASPAICNSHVVRRRASPHTPQPRQNRRKRPQTSRTAPTLRAYFPGFEVPLASQR